MNVVVKRKVMKTLNLSLSKQQLFKTAQYETFVPNC